MQKTNTIEECLLFLSARCDGAASEDSRGFNGRDAAFGNSLAAIIERGGKLTFGQLRAALSMMNTYTKQLLIGGLILPENYIKPVATIPDATSLYRIEADGEKLRLFAPYNPSLISILKSFDYKYKTYEATTKSWVINKAIAIELIEKVASFDFWIDPAVNNFINEVKSEELAARTNKELTAVGMAERIHRMISHYDLSALLPIGWSLRDYQIQGVEWLIAHTRGNLGRGAILADDMGLGKTVTAVCAARSIQAEYPNAPILVICPVSLMSNWRKEAAYVGISIETFSWAKLPPPLELTDYIVIADECFPAGTMVMTDRGLLPIDQIVEQRMNVNVLSSNIERSALEWKPVDRWIKKQRSTNMVRITHDSGTVYCTDNHKIWNEEHGYVKASDIEPGSSVRVLKKWKESQLFIKASSGQEEGFRTTTARVESVEILEQGYIDQSGLLCDHVYNLEIRDNHNYFAASVLVSNCHYAQGGTTTKRGKAFLELCKSDRCIAAWLLTGTPMKNGRPINLLPLLQAIDHPVAKSEWQFKMRYCAGHQKSIGAKTVWDFNGSAYLKELSDMLDDSLLRRLKTEVAKELPGKTRIVRPVEPTLSFREAVALAVSDYKRKIKAVAETDPVAAEKLRAAEALVTIGKIRGIASHFKMAAAIEIATPILEQGRQVVIFTEFLETANHLHEKLGGELLTGETKDRQGLVDRFQSGESKVFTGTIKAGGVGITLTAASELIVVDRPWTPGDLEQCEDRINRIGQVNACFCYWLQLGEVDKAIDELLHQKAERIELMLKGKRKTLRGVKSPAALAKALLENMI